MIKYLTEWLQWSYYYAPLIPQTRYIKHVIILILLVYILAVFDIRGFLNGMSLFYLTKRQRQKKLRKCSFKESFTYSRCRDEIPKPWMHYYWFVISIYPIIILFIILINVFCNTNPVAQYAVQLLVRGTVCLSIVVSILIECLFFKIGHGYAYDRWIRSPQERKNNPKCQKNATTAFVVAVVGLILSFLFALDGLILNMIGLVLAARAKAQQRSKANAALVISIIGLVFAMLHTVAGAVLAVAS